MDLILFRKYKRPDGIFGELLDASTMESLVHTLEHAFKIGENYVPAITAGIYQCQRGLHRLAHMSFDFTTFEIQNVSGHTGILFHTGNLNSDSEGCILVGTNLCQGPIWYLYRSLDAFNRLMNAQSGIDHFSLTVIDAYES